MNFLAILQEISTTVTLTSDLLIKGNITDTAHSYTPLKAPLDRILCLTEYITAAQIDVLIATHRRHHLSGHYQLTARST